MSIIYFLLIGLVAGWIAGLVMKGRGFGLLGNLLVGVLGAIIGGWLFGGLIGGGLVGSLIVAVIGALLLLFLVGLVKK